LTGRFDSVIFRPCLEIRVRKNIAWDRREDFPL
jgi:hypothetical protein